MLDNPYRNLDDYEQDRTEGGITSHAKLQKAPSIGGAGGDYSPVGGNVAPKSMAAMSDFLAGSNIEAVDMLMRQSSFN